MTIAIGFSTDSAIQIEQFQDVPWVSIPSWILFLLLVLVILPAAVVFRTRHLRHEGEIRQSSPEYLPPKRS